METQTFRNYDSYNTDIVLNYKNARQKQTLEKVVKELRPKYLNFNESKINLTILEALKELDKFIDLSDPDTSVPNSVHAFQTAEQMRKDNQPDWMQLVGLIHDLGKIMFLKGSDEDGTSLKNQCAIVGDTFIVGCPLPKNIVFPEFNCLNSDEQLWESIYGIYQPNCGLDECIVSFGHDEYFYQVLLYNGTTIPKEGLDMIRYHSLYSWHTGDEYMHLMNQSDKEKIKNVRLFNKYDLYTKHSEIVNQDISYYSKLIEKYIGLDKLTW